MTNASIPYEQRHPIILPSHSHTVYLLILEEHKRLFHAGPQSVLNSIRLRYWPVNAMKQIKKVIKGCVVCHRFRAVFQQQLMGQLSVGRVALRRAFLRVGIDFGGPIEVKESRIKKAIVHKAYIALFVCMATKAIHLELVSNLSSEMFLLSLKRFISRRGNPEIIFSDNGTTRRE